MTILANVPNGSRASATDVIELIDFAVTYADISNLNSNSFEFSGNYYGISVQGLVSGTGFSIGQVNGTPLVDTGSVSSVTFSSAGFVGLTLSNINVSMADFALIIESDLTGSNPTAIEDFLLSLDWEINLSDRNDFAPSSRLVGDDVNFNLQGDDIINGNGGDDNLYVGNGNDTVNGGDGDDFIVAGNGDDIVNGNAGNDIIFAGAGDVGDDTFDGGIGDDILGGGAGNDQLFGNDGIDTLFGGSGDDQLSGGSGGDTIWAGAGNDDVSGGIGADILGGGTGGDAIAGGEGADIIYGGSDAGVDSLTGGIDDDTLFGGGGADTLVGGFGNDQMYGGAGNDTFIFEDNHGDDSIGGFKSLGDNVLDLSELSGLTSFDDLSVTQSGADTTIDTGQGSITLFNTTASDFTAEDVIF